MLLLNFKAILKIIIKLLKTTNRHIIFFTLLIFAVSSCNLFRYGIEERKREREALGNNENITINKSERQKKADLILKSAKQYDGVPYKLGGNSKKGIDCSALVMLSYKDAGIALPRTSLEQSKMGQLISLKEAQPGDLIFFKFKKTKSKNQVNHVGIVSKVDKNGTVYFYHASTSLGVIESSLLETYFKEAFVKIMRAY